MQLNPTHTVLAIVTVAVAILAIGAVAIPILSDIAQDRSLDIDYHLELNGEAGATWTYEVTTNFEEWDLAISGSAARYAHIDGHTIIAQFTDPGTYTLEILVTAHWPQQSASQSVDFQVGKSESEMNTSPLLFAIPTILLVGLIVITIRRYNYV